MKSFVGILLNLLIDPGTLILIDEPEAFLHPPQIRHLAKIIASDTPFDTQVIIATHSDDFIRGILDIARSRIMVSRTSRVKNVNYITTLRANDITTLWRDPLLRTSDVLSSLFHEASIICEGDSDVRFYRAVLDSTVSDMRDPDFRFVHCGGKDRIAAIVSALKAVNVPVVAIVDIDVLSDKTKFEKLYETLGGDCEKISRDLKVIQSSVESRRAYLSGQELKVRIEQIVSDLDKMVGLPADKQKSLSQLIKDSSPWRRVKEDGYAGLGGGDAIASFRRLVDACMRVGLLINPVGELEGFCRVIGREQKSDWLAAVLMSDLRADPELREAREFAQQIRTVAQNVIKQNVS